jgi:uncharacterized protein involved in exopolysaccharide biosynthesis
MLQKVEFEDFEARQEDRGYLLQPAFYWQLIKRRWAVFSIPFLVVATAGVGAVMLWPPTYLSEGRILVQSQQIPTELVRPTVTSAAQERIQVIEQRTMTRDNLVAIADKFQLYPDKRKLMSASELVELMKKNIKIAPVDLMEFKQRSRLENPTIVFSVGFEDSDPEVATRVANELVTRILNEDLRDRTSRASDTTKFLAREVQKLQADNAALDARITQLKMTGGNPEATPNQRATTLARLREQLVQMGTLYSDKHPILQSLKRQIANLEKTITAPTEPDTDAGTQGTQTGTKAGTKAPTEESLDALTAQQEALQKNLDVATAKLDAARLGESLEKNQQSEKLEVIEQPTTPQQPVKPNRPKVSAIAVLLGLIAGAGLTFVAEMTAKGIRRASDIFGVIDSQMIVSIPYISTATEFRHQKRRVMRVIVLVCLILAGGLIVTYFYLPPLDLIIAKARVGLFR